MVQSNILSGKLGVIVRPVYSELQSENIYFRALSHKILTASLRFSFSVNVKPNYVYMSVIVCFSAPQKICSIFFTFLVFQI